MDAATKTGIDAAKTAFKKVVQKTAETTGDLIGNKIADKITSVGKWKEKTNKQEIYITPEKRQQIIDNLKLFWTNTLKYAHNYNNHNNHNYRKIKKNLFESDSVFAGQFRVNHKQTQGQVISGAASWRPINKERTCNSDYD